MKTRLILKVLGLFILILPQSVHSYETPQGILGADTCGSCHTGTPGISSDMAFALEDPEDNFSAVKTYEPNKTYRVHLRFQANGSANLIGYRLAARFFDLQKAGEIEDPEFGNFARSADDATLANYFDADLPAQINDIYINWQAPDSGANIKFFLDRVEANGNGDQTGDRGNPTVGVYIIKGSNGDKVEEEPMGETNSDGSMGSGAEFSNRHRTRNSSAYGNFSGGCGSIQSASPISGAKVFFWLIGLSFLFGLFIRSSYE